MRKETVGLENTPAIESVLLVSRQISVNVSLQIQSPEMSLFV